MKTVCALGFFVVAFLTLLFVRQSPLEQVDIVVNPYGVSPLSAICEITSSRPVRVERAVIEGVRTQGYSTELSRYHSIQLVGLTPGTLTVRLELVDEKGRRVYCPETEVSVAPLPEDLPTIRVLHSEPEWTGYLYCQVEGPSKAYQLLLSPLGEIVWMRARQPAEVLSLWLSQGRVLSLDLRRRLVETEELTGRRLASNIFPSVVLDQKTTRLESPSRAWGVQGDELVSLDLAGGSMQQISVYSLLGVHPSKTGPAWLPENSLVFSPELVAEVNPSARRVEWLAGDPARLHPALLPYCLEAEGGLYPHAPLASLWAQNRALLFVEQEQEFFLREYVVHLNERKITRDWSYPIRTGRKVGSVLLCESFQPGRIGLAVNQTDGTGRASVRLQMVTQQSAPKLLLDVQIEGPEGWSVVSFQVVESLF